MTDSMTTIWLIIIGSGGYILAVVQFFKAFLNVQKLELEIASLRKAKVESDRLVLRPTPDEIEEFRHPNFSSLRSGQSRNAVIGLVVLAVATPFLVTLLVDNRLAATNKRPSLCAVDHETKSVRECLDAGERRVHELMRDKFLLNSELDANRERIELLKKQEDASPKLQGQRASPNIGK